MNEIQIGNQIWSNENLNTTSFRNGENIPFVVDNLEWSELTTSAYCVTPNNTFFLYNYWTIIDERNVAPIGWRIPTENDWDTLINYIGGKENGGYKLKSDNGWFINIQDLQTQEIITKDFGGSNEFNFYGFSTGYRHMNGEFSSDLLSAFFLETSIDDDLAKYVFLFSGNEIGKGGMWKKDGFPIRLIKE